MKCKHDEEYEIAVDYMSVHSFERRADGSVHDEEGDAEPYGTFMFYCRRCGFNRLYGSTASMDC